MASVKITELNPSGPLTGSEVLPIVQGNETVKTTVQEIGSFTRPYKVYTALLTQSGGDDPITWLNTNNGSLIVGVTYEINNYKSGDDFTNVGAPSNVDGVQFVATGTTAANWSGATELNFNNGAPIVTVLENTIGNIWFTYDIVGNYSINSNSLFTNNKIIAFITFNNCCSTGLTDKPFLAINSSSNVDYVNISSALDGIDSDNVIQNTPIEIRVYN
jgi:hypothetical protein